MSRHAPHPERRQVERKPRGMPRFRNRTTNLPQPSP